MLTRFPATLTLLEKPVKNTYNEEEDIWPIHPIISSIDMLLFNYLGIYFGLLDP